MGKTVRQLIHKCYKAKGWKWPDTWEAMAFAITEIAEAYELMLASKSFVRNSSQEKESYSPERFESELADAIMMLQVAGMDQDLDPITRLFKRLEETSE